MKNPYLDLLTRLMPYGPDKFMKGFRWTEHSLKYYEKVHKYGKVPRVTDSIRHLLVNKFAWAIPCERSLRRIRTFVDGQPILEVGAKNGYWSWCLGQIGCAVHPIDKNPPTKVWVEVFKGNESHVKYFPNHVLMLCWPPYDEPMAHNCLSAYKGNKVIYIGEGCGGCTGDDKFHEDLSKNFNLFADMTIPVYWGIHDRLFLYERK